MMIFWMAIQLNYFTCLFCLKKKQPKTQIYLVCYQEDEENQQTFTSAQSQPVKF